MMEGQDDWDGWEDEDLAWTPPAIRGRMPARLASAIPVHDGQAWSGRGRESGPTGERLGRGEEARHVESALRPGPAAGTPGHRSFQAAAAGRTARPLRCGPVEGDRGKDE